MKRIIISAGAALLLAAIAVFGFAGTAQAHVIAISHTVVCDTETYTYDVGIHIGNSEGNDGTVVAVEDGNPIVKVGDIIPPAGRDYVLHGVTSPVAGVINVTVKWADNVTSTKHDELKLSDFGPCNAPPAQPEPIIVVTYDEWADQALNCQTGTATQGRTKTTTTTNYIWINELESWVQDEPVVTTESETQSRDLSPAELDACAGDKPVDLVTVTYTEWTDAAWACDATSTTQSREAITTTQSYGLVDHKWAITASSEQRVVETQQRELTADEKTVCPIITTSLTTPPALATTGVESAPWLIGGLLAVIVGVAIVGRKVAIARRPRYKRNYFRD